MRWAGLGLLVLASSMRHNAPAATLAPVVLLWAPGPWIGWRRYGIAIATWVVIMGSTIPKHTRLEGLACTIGVLIGSSAWFMLVAFLTHRGTNVPRQTAALTPAIAGVGLLLSARTLPRTGIQYLLLR